MKERVIICFNAPSIIIYLFLINIFVFAILTIAGTTLQIELIILGLVSFYYIASLSLKLPTKILIDPTLNCITIKSLRFLIHKKEEQHNINELVCTYKDEMRVKGIIIKVLRIRNTNGDGILELMPRYNGWNEDKLKMIYQSLQPK